MLAVVSEELPDVPFYYVQDRLCAITKLAPGKLTHFRSALLNAGYRVSLSHAHKLALKTDAPNDFIWDMVRAWEKDNPAKRDNLEGVAKAIIVEATEPFMNDHNVVIDFTDHPDANPPSRTAQLKR
jgi:tRNA (guanine26-N2/guanine27-N2)-dimethyltransferase